MNKGRHKSPRWKIQPIVTPFVKPQMKPEPQVKLPKLGRRPSPNVPSASEKDDIWPGALWLLTDAGRFDPVSRNLSRDSLPASSEQARQGTKTRKWGKSPECSMERREGRREECGWEVTGEKRRYKSSRSWNHTTESHGWEGKWGSGRTKAAIARTTERRRTGWRGRAVR